MKCVPPLNELFEQAGMSLPEYLGKTQPPKAETSSTEEDSSSSEKIEN
jgi:flotillin